RIGFARQCRAHAFGFFRAIDGEHNSRLWMALSGDRTPHRARTADHRVVALQPGLGRGCVGTLPSGLASNRRQLDYVSETIFDRPSNGSRTERSIGGRVESTLGRLSACRAASPDQPAARKRTEFEFK